MNSNIPAILIQGKFYDSFTYKLVQYYTNILKYHIIIISCWEDCIINESITSNTNIHIIKNKIPKFPGSQNINFQRITTLAGLKYIKKLGITKAIKTRSDHKINNINEILSTISNKIIVLKSCKFFLNPFFVCDFIYFGSVTKLITIFDFPLSNEIDDRKILLNKLSFLKKELLHYQMKSFIFAESRIMLKFFLKTNSFTESRFTNFLNWRSFRKSEFTFIPINKYNVLTIKDYASLNYSERVYSFEYFNFLLYIISSTLFINKIKLYIFKLNITND